MRSVTLSLFVMGFVLVGLSGMAHADTIPIENATFDTGLDGPDTTISSANLTLLSSGGTSGSKII